jgi:hypothetical protein
VALLTGGDDDTLKRLRSPRGSSKQGLAVEKLFIKYRTAGKAFAPRPIELGASELIRPGKTYADGINASFREAATYGLELVYQYQTECRVTNENGQVRINWDYAKEPGGVLGWDEFSDTAPKPSQDFIFGTSVDLQAPPGYVVRIESHPRFFTDTTGTVPPALAAHVRTEWWPKKLFVVFKGPPRGHTYIFRKGEPYVQILFVPQDRTFEPKPMSKAEPSVSHEHGNGPPPASTQLDVRYHVTGKSFPPQATRLATPGWSGSPEIKMENGSEPQPWHCSPFREGATYGMELLYQHDADCHVSNDNGQIRFERIASQEPGDNEFSAIGPAPCRFYRFETSVELQAPPGYVLRTEPHPRNGTDHSGTVPMVVCSHVKADEPTKLCVVFKAPQPGQRHIFRKGEPYVQILAVPQPMTYDTVKMSPEEETQRSTMENGIFLAKSYIAKHVWHNPDGLEFNDHYRVLERAFEHDGVPGVQATIAAAVERQKLTVPLGRTVKEYLDLADRYKREGKYVEAKETLIHARGLDPNNAETACRIGLLQWDVGLRELGLKAMEAAVRLQPRSSEYRAKLGEMQRELAAMKKR